MSGGYAPKRLQNLYLKGEVESSNYSNLVSVLDDALLIRAKTFVKIFRAFYEAIGSDSLKFWYKLGNEAGEEMGSILIAKMKTKRARIVKFLLSQSHSAGWGKITYCGKRFGGIDGTIRVENSPLLKNDTSGAACEFYKGYIMGFLNKIYGVGEIKCSGSSCLRKGSNFCELMIERNRESWLRSVLFLIRNITWLTLSSPVSFHISA
ncbi:MAG: hypothetical protein ACUVTL_03685 [Thermoproteota archaeon]